MKILWVGPFFGQKAIQDKRAPNLAAMKWSAGLLRGLASCGCELRVIDHCTEQRWPAGKVFWQDGNPKWFQDWLPCVSIPYLNVMGVKDWWLSLAYARATKRVVGEWRPDVLLAYNSLHAFNVAAMRVATKMGVTCIPIILDGDDPRRDCWRKLLRDNRFADGVVFLSWWMYKNYPKQGIPLLHMDGGADAFKGDPPSAHESGKPFMLVHTGALDYWRGLEFMKKVVRVCKRQDVRFVLCGKCDKEKMWTEFGNDPRMEVKGLVSETEMDMICRDADVFLSVRTPGLGDNIVNYPSKIPNYLSWGKPIVSTWNDSFSPDYRSVLEVSDDTPEGFAALIDKVLTWDADAKQKKFRTIRTWFEDRKSWGRQSMRLVEWLKAL